MDRQSNELRQFPASNSQFPNVPGASFLGVGNRESGVGKQVPEIEISENQRPIFRIPTPDFRLLASLSHLKLIPHSLYSSYAVKSKFLPDFPDMNIDSPVTNNNIIPTNLV